MKKKKLTLGIVTALIGVAGLSACNEVTYSDGVVLEYTDAQGNKLKYTTEELFGEQYTTGAASTDFDKVYEVLVRKYYETGSGKGSLAEIKELANKDVSDIKDQANKNAKANGTSYQEELSKLLKNNDCDNIDALYDLKVYEEEKKKFEAEFDTNETVEKMRDGNGIYESDPELGEGSDGYLVEQMPYTVSHILVKFGSASAGEHAEATVSADESRNLGQVVKLLAGARLEDETGREASNKRMSFGEIAKLRSEDTGSAEKNGQLDVMDRDTADGFIQEFKFGIYAYDAIFNQNNKYDEATGKGNAYASKATRHGNSGEEYKLSSKILYSDKATYTDKSLKQTATEKADGLAEGEHYIADFFAKEENQIGRIPFGAAVAMAKEDVYKNDFDIAGEAGTKMNWKVNDNNEHFFPRNILFNKYFNNHRVSVIVPNEISYNDPAIPELVTEGDYTTENFIGEERAYYAGLPGFQSTTALPGIGPVLTNERGQVVLVVRGGGDSYQGVHFMVIDRSALEQIVTVNPDFSTTRVDVPLDEYNSSALKTTTNTNSLSEFYTIYKPGESSFPAYEVAGGTVDKITYVNQLKDSATAYNTKMLNLRGKVADYNPNKNTYMFQKLMKDGNVVFSANPLAQTAKNLIVTWVSSKRAKSTIDSREKFDDAWATYVEYLTAMDEARSLNKDGSQRLISERCAIGYNKKSSDPNGDSYGAEWKTGGACYAI